jgi:hypothetical protein
MQRIVRDLGSTVGVVLATGQTFLSGLIVTNTVASLRYVKLYDSLAAPTEALTPVATIPINANQTVVISNGASGAATSGVTFMNGLGLRVTTDLADNSTLVQTAGDVIVNALVEA